MDWSSHVDRYPARADDADIRLHARDEFLRLPSDKPLRARKIVPARAVRHRAGICRDYSRDLDVGRVERQPRYAGEKFRGFDGCGAVVEEYGLTGLYVSGGKPADLAFLVLIHTAASVGLLDEDRRPALLYDRFFEIHQNAQYSAAVHILFVYVAATDNPAPFLIYKIPVIIRRTQVIIISEPGGNVEALINRPDPPGGIPSGSDPVDNIDIL